MADRLVVDASVAAKWFLNDEKDVDLAEEILANFLAGNLELHAPRVFSYEVCALLAKACGTITLSGDRRLSKSDGLEAVRHLFALDINRTDLTEPAAVKSLEMSVDCSKTFKDMSYIDLSISLQCQWCTADDKVLKGIPATYPKNNVLLLSTLRTPQS